MTPDEKAMLDMAIYNTNQLQELAVNALKTVPPQGSYQDNVRETDSELTAGLKILLGKQRELLTTFEEYYRKQNQDALSETQEESNSQGLGPIL